MCVPALGAAAAAAPLQAAGLAISAVGTVASIGMGIMSAQQQAAQAQAQMNMQARQQELSMQQQRQSMIQAQQQQRQTLLQNQRQQQDQYNLQVQQSNTSILNQYNQQRAQVEAERANIAAKQEADLRAYQNSKETADTQVRYNNEAANRVYQQEQAKMTEARKKAAFAQQTALAKSIGSKGAILSAGRTGQSVGLLVNDAERQSGFEQAMADASMESTLEQSQISMDQAFLQSIGANNRALSNVGMKPTDPYMPQMPGIPAFVDPFQDSEPALA